MDIKSHSQGGCFGCNESSGHIKFSFEHLHTSHRGEDYCKTSPKHDTSHTMTIRIRLIGIVPRCGSAKLFLLEPATVRLARMFATHPRTGTQCTLSSTLPTYQPRQNPNWRLLWRQHLNSDAQRAASPSTKPAQTGNRKAGVEGPSASKGGRPQRMGESDWLIRTVMGY